MPNPTYVPLKEAAEKYHIDESVLAQLVAAGMIEVALVIVWATRRQI